jgi:hypothetical protein
MNLRHRTFHARTLVCAKTDTKCSNEALQTAQQPTMRAALPLRSLAVAQTLDCSLSPQISCETVVWEPFEV